jgi:hypothetical protein
MLAFTAARPCQRGRPALRPVRRPSPSKPATCGVPRDVLSASPPMPPRGRTCPSRPPRSCSVTGPTTTRQLRRSLSARCARPERRWTCARDRAAGVCRRAVASHNADGSAETKQRHLPYQFHAAGRTRIAGLLSLIATCVPPPPAVGGPTAGVGGPETAPQRRLAGATAGFEPATGSRGDRDSSTPQRRLQRFVSGRVGGLTGVIGQTSAGCGGVSSTNGCLSNLTSGKPPASRDGPDDCCLPSREQRVAQRAGDCWPRRGAAVWTCAPARGPRQACRTRRPRRLLASEKRASTARPFTNIRVRPLLSWTMSHRV